MISYSIDTNARRNTSFILALIAILISVAISALASDFGIIFSLSTFSVFCTLYWLYDRWVWRCPVFQNLHGVPYFGGRTWKGKIEWSTVDGQIKSTQVHAIVAQTWSKIQFEVISPEASSFVRSAAIYTARPFRKTILYVYDLRPLKHPEKLFRAEGCQELILEEDGSLHGSYFSSRPKVGGLHLVPLQANTVA